MTKISIGSLIWVSVPGVVLVADPDLYEFTASETDGGSAFMVKLTPVTPCPLLALKHEPLFYFPDSICGIAEFKLYKDLRFQRFTFEAPGLPIPAKIDGFGQCTLQRYHLEVEFQQVTLPGDKEPFLIPKQLAATLETNKGKIAIASAYEPRQPKK